MSGASGGRLKGQPWRLTFRFTHWRFADGVLHTGEMYVSKPVEQPEISALQELIRPNSIIRIRATWGIDVDDDIYRVELIEFIGPADDPALSTIAAKLATPHTVTVEPFGDLTLDRRFSLFSGTTTWAEATVRIELPANDADLSNDMREQARAFFAAHAEWDDRLRTYAAQALLDLKNGSWHEEDERIISEEEFKQRMEPQSVSLEMPDEFVVFYRDGDLFFGHVIIVSGTISDGPNDASIAG